MIGAYEVESKWSIIKGDFDRLLSRCVVLRRFDQLNVYFDNDWVLANAGATCRVRFVPQGGVTFTLKIPVLWESDGARRSIEIESPAHSAFQRGFQVCRTELNFSLLNPELRSALSPLNVSVLRRVGWMRNSRHVIRLPSGWVVELDRFTLPGGEAGFEIEIEEEGLEKRAAILSELRSLVPAAVPSNLSKFQRFSEAVKRRHRIVPYGRQ